MPAARKPAAPKPKPATRPAPKHEPASEPRPAPKREPASAPKPELKPKPAATPKRPSRPASPKPAAHPPARAPAAHAPAHAPPPVRSTGRPAGRLSLPVSRRPAPSARARPAPRPAPHTQARPHTRPTARHTPRSDANVATRDVPRAAPGRWFTTGATWFTGCNGAGGNLCDGHFYYAELGTANRVTGAGTGHGWLARLFGLGGELPMGAGVWIRYGSKTTYATKKDRGYGQGGDGYTSDSHFAIDLHEETAHYLGFNGKGNVEVSPNFHIPGGGGGAPPALSTPYSGNAEPWPGNYMDADVVFRQGLGNGAHHSNSAWFYARGLTFVPGAVT